MRILLTGATGMLGSAVLQQWPQAADEFVPVSRTTTPAVDLSDSAAPEHLNALGPLDAIVHTAALSRVADCERQPELARRTNVAATVSLGRWARQHQIPMLFTSTDMVFDGEQGGYRGCDLPAPRTLYGQTKLAAEQQLLAVYPEATVVRLSLLLRRGWGFLQWLETEWAAGRAPTIFSDQFRTPLLVDDAVRVFAALLQGSPKAGILHLGGPERVSRWQMAAGFAQRLGWPPEQLVAKTRAQVNLPHPVERDLSLVSEPEFLALGLHNLDASLDRLTQPG